MTKTQKILQSRPPCYYCGKRAENVDHAIPKSRGGSDNMTSGNLLPSCLQCNEEKANMTLEEYRVYRTARHIIATQGAIAVINLLTWIPEFRFYAEEK